MIGVVAGSGVPQNRFSRSPGWVLVVHESDMLQTAVIAGYTRRFILVYFLSSDWMDKEIDAFSMLSLISLLLKRISFVPPIRPRPLSLFSLFVLLTTWLLALSLTLLVLLLRTGGSILVR